ncbi:DNA alkylation repair protein [Jeongeupia naejangsanensis]|uniref:DNA alkylation repair protein n=1 Tax=Jeongeupia naejangsanensis TaxID=613195 RepID=A0ABS2BJD5_9NEIS|nr:DNA alkylation repair protein [Jeongeupia naejangsanensis]MBM3115722.1 DNA alkylation repair protein [Jeongeupia naejangsanensis]
METAAAFTDAVVAGLAPLADPATAAPMAAYMRGRFAFLGIKTPARRSVSTPLIRAARKSMTPADRLAAAQKLWALPEREYLIVAVDLLADRPATLGIAVLPVLDTLIGSKSWWDSVDGLAASVVGPLLQAEPALRTVMDDWAGGDRLWHARTALLFQLGYKTDTDTTRLFGYCRALADHPDFFIRKAIGWALRQYARTDADAVRGFVATERERLSPLSVREALKHLGD